MPTYHKVEQGECLSCIAKQYGFMDYRAVYDHPRNALLKQKRPNPNILYPGDCLFIPDMQEKHEHRGTGQNHVFHISRHEVLLRLVLKNEEDQPYVNTEYALKIHDQRYTGTTNAQGLIEHKIPADTKQAELTFWPDEEDTEGYRFLLAVGHLDPVEEITGVQARLNNLGFPCGEIDGILGPRTQAALKAFQTISNLSATGDADHATRKELRKAYDGV